MSFELEHLTKESLVTMLLEEEKQTIKSALIALDNAIGRLVIEGNYKIHWSNGRLRYEGVVKAKRFVGQVKSYNRLGVLIGVYDGQVCLGRNEEEFFMGKSW